MKNQTSIVTFEKGTKGLVTVGYTAEGNNLSGFYIKTYIKGKSVATKGTPSSGCKKRFAKLPSHFLS